MWFSLILVLCLVSFLFIFTSNVFYAVFSVAFLRVFKMFFIFLVCSCSITRYKSYDVIPVLVKNALVTISYHRAHF